MVNSLVSALAPDGNGGWYLGGVFTAVQGQPRTRLAHVDAGGNVTAWNPGSNGSVYALARASSTSAVASRTSEARHAVALPHSMPSPACLRAGARTPMPTSWANPHGDDDREALTVV